MCTRYLELETISTVLVTALTIIIVSVSSQNSNEYGRQMAVRSHQGICWYEYLKFFPATKSREFVNCHIQAPNVLRQIKDQGLDNKYFGQWMQELAMGHLPKQYQNCNNFLQEPNKIATVNHGDVVLESTEKAYPFRGFVHCLVDELEVRHGKDGVAKLKKKMTQQDHWKLVILDRENEFRQRHSSEPLKLAKQLSTQAQKWAETIAQECNPRHSKGSDPDRRFQGEGTGESLAMSSALNIPAADTALVAANGWYEEIKDYPFPEGYNGDGADSLFPKIGHFTQTVWKGSQFVGYGYALCGRPALRRQYREIIMLNLMAFLSSLRQFNCCLAL